MASIIKRMIRIFNGTDWDSYYPKTSSDQVVHTKADGTATTVQEELLAQRSAISHIGSIIQTTTLDTMEKVIAIYGGTTWVKIEGRFLLGQSSDYAVKSTGGAKSVSYTPKGTNAGTALNANQIPSHNHKVNQDVYNVGPGSGATVLTYQAGANGSATASTGGGQTHTHTFTGTNATIATMPPYKTVYIWERTA